MSDVSEVVSGKSLDELMAIQEAALNEIENANAREISDFQSGCKALDGCDRKELCHRYHLAQQQNWMHGWSGYQLCRMSEFKDNPYLFFVEKTDEPSH